MSGGIVASSVGKTGCSLGKPDGGAGKAAGAVGKVVRSDGKIVRSDGKIVRSDGKVVSCDGKFVSYGGIVTHCLLDSADLRGMSPAVPKFPWLAWCKSAPLPPGKIDFSPGMIFHVCKKDYTCNPGRLTYRSAQWVATIPGT